MKKTLVSALTTALVVGAASTTFAAANPFEDVPADHWAYDAIAQLAADGVIEGYGDGTYRGDQEITRYEMAQMVARAMAKGGGDKALIDKLAAEFADELNNLGVRVAALEKKVDNVKWGGRLRYRYIHMNHEGGVPNNGNKDDHRNINELRLRFEPQMKINEHWTGKARLDYYHGTNMNDARNETGGDLLVDRMWVQGDYKNLQIHLGKLTYKSQADEGLFINRYLSGGNVIFGNDIKVSLAIGRMNIDNNKIGTDYTWRANGVTNGYAVNGQDAAATYGAIEVYNNRKNKFTWGIGYHRVGTRNFESGVYDPIRDRLDGGAGLDSDNISILGLGLGYKFTPDIRLNAAWTHAFGADIRSDLKDGGMPDINGSQKNSYVVQLNFKGADKNKVNSWGAYVAWRQIGMISSTGWTTYSLLGPQYTGSRGFEIGAEWTPMKNVVGSLKWFTGKDLAYFDGNYNMQGGNMNNNEKVNTIFTEWNFFF